MSVSARIVRRRAQTNGSLEVISWEGQLPSPSPSPLVPSPSRDMVGPQLQVLVPEAAAASAAFTPQSFASSPRARPSRRVARRRKVSSAPPPSMPVGALSATYPSAAFSTEHERRVNSADFSPSASVGRRHIGRRIQEAKEFCVDTGADVGVTLEALEEDDSGTFSGDNDDDDDDEPFDAQTQEDFEQESLADDPIGLAKPEAATPRLTAHDISTIQDPATLDFLTKNRATLARYLSLDQSFGSRASTPAVSAVERDWTFVTRPLPGNAFPVASPTASEALSLSSIQTPSWVPNPGGPSVADLGTVISPHLSPDVLNGLPSLVVSDMEPDELGWSVGRLSIGSSEEGEEEPAVELDTAMEECSQTARSDDASSTSEPARSPAEGAPRSFFGKTGPSSVTTKPARKDRSLGSDVSSSVKSADTVHYRLTEEEECKVKAILGDARFNTEAYELADGEGYSLSSAEAKAMHRLDQQLAALRQARGGEEDNSEQGAPATEPAHVLQLEAVEKDKEALVQEGKEKANQFLQESRAERAKESQLSAIHRRLKALYEAEVAPPQGDVHLPPDALQRLLREAQSQRPLHTAPAEPPDAADAEEPTGYEWEAEWLREEQRRAGEAEAAAALTVGPATVADEAEDEEEAALSHRIAEARARLALRQTPAFNEEVFWEERDQWDAAELDDANEAQAME
eukprot:GGOE01044016.1.p1 GENE.GGOE01044016.1~~GGOE01044016.1.p1  ORF type:complete len:687 (+),score=197.82 GGOE01044016.1:155-2215(+)